MGFQAFNMDWEGSSGDDLVSCSFTPDGCVITTACMFDTSRREFSYELLPGCSEFEVGLKLVLERYDRSSIFEDEDQDAEYTRTHTGTLRVIQNDMVMMGERHLLLDGFPL